MSPAIAKPSIPTADKRWRIVDATMRRHGYTGHALIESLHSAQECFGYLDKTSLRFIAASLRVPLSKAYGVATFYHYFTLKPPGEHTCVVCLGTACYIKGAGRLIKDVQERFGVKPGQTTRDNQLSVLMARCLGSCSLAPAAVIDGEVVGNLTSADLIARLERLVKS